MNLIEQLGGYNAAKAEANASVKLMNSFSYDQLDKELLEYRRENSIYEDGDKIVFHKGKKDIWDFYTKSGIKPYDIAVCNSKFIKYTYAKNIRHAKPEELEIGHRL